jgi:signal transduction histidine kinase/CheY-like chemotaxis protein
LRIFPRAIPLAVQLMCVLVGLVLGTTLTLTVFAYRSSVGSLETSARTSARTAAMNRADGIARMLALRRRNAEGLLASALSLCGEQAGAERVAWATDCVRPMVQELRRSERALGMEVLYDNRLVMRVGQRISHGAAAANGAARVFERPDGTVAYQMRSTAGALALVADFDFDEIASMFEDRSGLGRGGEVFLVGSDGRFLTAPRYGDTAASADIQAIEPVQACSQGAGTITAVDYRGVRAFHSFAPIAALGGACVDAHIPVHEALAPAESLQAALVSRGIAFACIGGLLSLIAAQWIARPVRRLASSARSVKDGNFEQPISVAGPSEVRQLARAFRAMRDELARVLTRERAARDDAQSANASKDEFLAMVSHELRTPLTAILGWVHLAREGRLDAESLERALISIERSAGAQRRLIEDLLDATRAIKGTMRLAATDVRLDWIVGAAVESIRPAAAEKQIVIEEHVEPIPLRGDADRLQQVVANLVGNAVKFTPRGGRVTVAARQSGATAEITVCDTGDGIAPDLLPHIFEWFRQGNSSRTRRHSGLGLGLGIVRQLVELHGGTVQAESGGEGRGAMFTVMLPISAAPAILAPVGPIPELSIPRLDSLHVLVVEDDENMIGMIRAVLESAGATVDVAFSAVEAHRTVSHVRPDVIISDISMPDHDGYWLLRSLRAAAIDMPAIALTALTRRDDEADAIAAGFQVHLHKPVNPAVLVQTVARLGSAGAAVVRH